VWWSQLRGYSSPPDSFTMRERVYGLSQLWEGVGTAVVEQLSATTGRLSRDPAAVPVSVAAEVMAVAGSSEGITLSSTVEGGEAGQTDARGGRGGRSGLPNFRLPDGTSIYDYRRGGDGGNPMGDRQAPSDLPRAQGN